MKNQSLRTQLATVQLYVTVRTQHGPIYTQHPPITLSIQLIGSTIICTFGNCFKQCSSFHNIYILDWPQVQLWKEGGIQMKQQMDGVAEH